MAVAIESGTLRFGPYTVDLQIQRLHRDGVWIKLPRQSFLILEMLLVRAGGVVTREELCTALWSSDTFIDFDHGLNNAVNRIRTALQDCAETPTYIETLPRLGYRFIAEVQSLKSGCSTRPATRMGISLNSPVGSIVPNVVEVRSLLRNGPRWKLLVPLPILLSSLGKRITAYAKRNRSS